jgi:LmbE family N-acetylglucosaminyl deacetylase
MRPQVLVLAPHPDDESLGCGGAICRHHDAGDRVTCVFLTSGELGLRHLAADAARHIREEEAEAAAAVLGIDQLAFLRLPDWWVGDHMDEAVRALAPVLEAQRPNLIYLPHPAEWHPDHRACLPLLQHAVRCVAVPAGVVRLYEVWTPLQDYQHVEDISALMPRKLRALRCHRSQIESLRYDRAVRGLNAYRGVMAQCGRFAEVFGTLDIGAPRA